MNNTGLDPLVGGFSTAPPQMPRTRLLPETLHTPQPSDDPFDTIYPTAAGEASLPSAGWHNIERPFIRMIGQGGMSHVYLTRQLPLGRQVAVKVMKPDVAQAGVQALSEAQLLAQLQHPNIITIYETGVTHENAFYFIMEYAVGGSLDHLVQKNGPLAPKEAAALVRDVALALAFAHRSQSHIIHRDIKPNNILLTHPEGAGVGPWIPKLADFGISLALDHTSPILNDTLAGTIAYMSCEQATHGAQIDQRTDIYSLGAVLYFCLTKRSPYATQESVSDYVLLERVRRGQYTPLASIAPAAPADLVAICQRAMAPNPADRYCTAQEFADDLANFLADREVLARPYPWRERLWRSFQAHRAQLIVAVCALLVGVHLFLGLQYRWRLQTLTAGLASLETLTQSLNSDDQADPRELQSRIAKIKDQLAGDIPRSYQHSLAEKLHQLAETLDELGRHDLAESTWKDLSDRLLLWLKSDASDEALKQILSQVRLQRGKSLVDQLRYREAESEYQAILNDVPNLPTEKRALLEAEAHHLLGQLNQQRNLPSLAIEHYGKAIEIRDRLCQENPSNVEFRRDLGRGHGFLGDVYLDLRDFDKAEVEYKKSDNQRTALVEATRQPGESDQQMAKRENAQNALWQWARSFTNTGSLHIARNQPEEAIAAYSRARKLQCALIEASPLVSYREDLGWTTLNLLELHLDREGPLPAHLKPMLDDAVKLHVRLLRDDPDHFSNAITQVRCQICVAKYLARTSPGDLEPLRKALDRAQEMFEAIARKMDQSKRTTQDSVRRNLAYYRGMFFALRAEHLREADPAKLRRLAILDLFSAVFSSGYKNSARLKADMAFRSLWKLEKQSMDLLITKCETAGGAP
jgi:tetratricopeptide (TPR) repeat protein